MDDGTRERIDAARARSIEHVRNAIAIEQAVIEQNLAMLDGLAPTQLDPAEIERRIVEAQSNLGQLEIELIQLEGSGIAGGAAAPPADR